MTWSAFPGAVALTVLVPEQTAAVDVHWNTLPAATGVDGHPVPFVSVPLTKIETALTGIVWLPVFLNATVVPDALSIRIFCACWFSCVKSCVSVFAVAVWATLWNQTNAKPTIEIVMRSKRIIAITGVMPFITNPFS